MVTVEIDGTSASLEEAVTAGWIPEQIKRRERDGRKPCVKVTISEHGIRLSLTTPTCSTGGGGGGRPPNQKEKEVLDLWSQHGLNQLQFTPGNLQAFLRRLSQLF